jgi:hypothetical protein
MFEPVPAQDTGSMELDYPEDRPTLKFRAITYALETPADEAIALADIMSGATPAIASHSQSSPQATKTGSGSSAGNAAVKEDDKTASKENFLTPEDEQCKFS